MSTPSSAAPSRPATRPAIATVRPAVIARGALIGASLAIYALVIVNAGLHHQDLDAYLGAARDVLHGKPLYATFLQHPFPDPTLRPAYIYPPAFAVFIAPLGLLPSSLAAIVWMIANQAALAASAWIFQRWRRPPAWATAAIIAATVSFYPLWVDVAQGQANLMVLFLVIAGLVGVLRGDARLGAAIGVAAALKLTPALLLIWLLLDRRVRAATWMVAGFAGVTALGALIRFPDTLTFFTRVVPALAGGTAVYGNQSLGGFIARIATRNPYTDPWAVLPYAGLVTGAIVIALIAFWFVRTRGLGQPPGHAALLRAGAFLPLLPLASSVTWPHHLVILLPVIWLCFMAIAERGWPVTRTVVLCALLVVFDVLARWPVGPGFGQSGFRAAQTADPVVFLVANSLFFATIMFFLIAPWLLRD